MAEIIAVGFSQSLNCLRVDLQVFIACNHLNPPHNFTAWRLLKSEVVRMIQESLQFSIASIIGDAHDWHFGQLDDLNQSSETTSIA